MNGSIPSDLVTALCNTLVKHGYAADTPARSAPAELAALLVTPRRLMTRLACAVVEAPEENAGLRDLRDLYKRVRHGLGEQYGQWPWFKEIGTFVVLLCGHPVYQTVRGYEGAFRDNTGLHVNIILGSCFVDIDEYAAHSERSWGLWSSRKHFDDMCAAITRWCTQQREHNKSVDHYNSGRRDEP
jgi:hypothetical protein